MQYGDTALISSAANANLEVVKLLLQRGAVLQHRTKVMRGKGLEVVVGYGLKELR